MITRDIRYALGRALAAAGYREGADPGLRTTGIPGQYAASVALTLGATPRETAGALAGTLAREPWIAAVDVTGPGYLTITVTRTALAAVADQVIQAGPACVTSDALAGMTLPAPPPGDPLAAPTWEEARTALAARVTARLAAAAGATVAELASTERSSATHQASPSSLEPRATATSCAPPANSDDVTGECRTRSGGPRAEPDATSQRQKTACSEGSSPRETTVADAVAFAGRDAVTFTLARAIPGKPLRVDPEKMARHVHGNPAYAVRYAHARAASEVRWAAASAGTPELFVPQGWADIMAVCAIGPALRDTGGYGGSLPREITAALSWLPERVATAARRGRPDEFARYLEDLASATVDVLSPASYPGNDKATGSDRLTIARAARTGLAAGLGLLGVAAPDRL